MYKHIACQDDVYRYWKLYDWAGQKGLKEVENMAEVAFKRLVYEKLSEGCTFKDLLKNGIPDDALNSLVKEAAGSMKRRMGKH
jgi:hypothetical protein